MDRLDDWLALARIPGLHAGQLRDWCVAGRSPLDLLGNVRRDGELPVMPARVLQSLWHPAPVREIEQDKAWLAADPRRRLVVWGDAAYPPLLSQIPDAPLVLYVEGDPAPLAMPQLAIVGSRNPTALGRDTARQFAKALGQSGLVVTSGLALGIDAAAHRGALDAAAKTVAVLGRGLDAIYPSENASLAQDIVRAGGTLVTDIPVGIGPLKHNFPRRNRILSGLAVGTLVVEAALQSGSLITARFAADQGREVFAIPGSIHNAVARGCHRLLRQGAKLVETVADILEELAPILCERGVTCPSTGPIEPASPLPRLDKDYEILLDALGFEPAGLDALVARTGLQTGSVASMLLILELDGRIQQQPGGRYSRRCPGR